MKNFEICVGDAFKVGPFNDREHYTAYVASLDPMTVNINGNIFSAKLRRDCSGYFYMSVDFYGEIIGTGKLDNYRLPFIKYFECVYSAPKTVRNLNDIEIVYPNEDLAHNDYEQMYRMHKNLAEALLSTSHKMEFNTHPGAFNITEKINGNKMGELTVKLWH